MAPRLDGMASWRRNESDLAALLGGRGRWGSVPTASDALELKGLTASLTNP
jgi:hypothetical protein